MMNEQTCSDVGTVDCQRCHGCRVLASIKDSRETCTCSPERVHDTFRIALHGGPLNGKTADVRTGMANWDRVLPIDHPDLQRSAGGYWLGPRRYLEADYRLCGQDDHWTGRSLGFRRPLSTAFASVSGEVSRRPPGADSKLY